MFLRSEIYVIFSQMLLLTLSFGAHKSHVWAKRYEFKPGWIANNTWPPILPICGSEGTYKPLFLDYQNHTMISSDNGRFCLAMYVFDNNPKDYYLTVVMGCNVTGEGVPVWIANRNAPCPSSYVFRFSRSYNSYHLYDDQNTNWASPTSLGSAELQDSGNWVLYDNSTLGAVIWQTFDHPTDVLLPGQSLIGSSKLYSRKNLSSAATGSFSATVETGRFVLYFNVSSSSSQSYYTFPSCVSSNTTVTYKYPSLQISSSECSSTQIATFESSQSAALNFLRLDNDGNLVSHTLLAGIWTTTQYFKNPCQLPFACGPYGLCSGNGQCQCLIAENGTVKNASLTSTKNKCNSLAVTDETHCNQNTARNNHFVRIQARYFSNISMHGTKNAEACKEACLDNCPSCKAYSYTSKKGCFILNDTIVASFVPDNETEIFLRFRNTNPASGALPSNTKTTKAAVIGLIVAAFVIVCMVVAVIKLLRRKPINVVNKEINKSLAGIEGLPPRFTCQEMEAATEGYSKKLGVGGFGSVYEGMLKNGKSSSEEIRGHNTGAKQFVAEVATMANIGHVNIVRLCGFCIENNEQMLVYDFMPNGSLDHWLFGNEGKTLTWKDRMEIAIGTARGLSYLHEGCEPPIFHLDVKPQNILLDENFVPKVADFGLAKQVERDTSGVVTCVRGTSGYMAPEWIMHSLATKKCDVYGFGMVLLELLGEKKSRHVKRTHKFRMVFSCLGCGRSQAGRTMEIIDPEIRVYVPVKQGTRFIHVALWCIQDIATLRPSMEEVVQILEGLREVEEPPLFPFSNSHSIYCEPQYLQGF